MNCVIKVHKWLSALDGMDFSLGKTRLSYTQRKGVNRVHILYVTRLTSNACYCTGRSARLRSTCDMY